MIESLFKQLGLKKGEDNIYFALLESGPTPAGRLAKKLDIPRSSLYGTLEVLQKKGLVRQSEKHAVKLWHALPPEKIGELIEQKQDAWKHTADTFEKILPKLQATYIEDVVHPRFHLFEGKEGVKQALKDMLLYNDLETEAFWPIRTMIETLGEDFFIALNKRRIRQNLYTRALWPADKIVNIKKYPFLGVGKQFKREIRKAPRGIDTAMGYWAYGNRVVFISSRAESFGFVVESKELRQLLKTQFDMLWNMAKPITCDRKYTDGFLKSM